MIESTRVGDRIGWQGLHSDGSCMDSKQGEIVRVDIHPVSGTLVQLVVFNDDWEFVTVTKKDLTYVRKIPIRPALRFPKRQFRVGDTVESGGMDPSVVVALLPNYMLLLETPKGRLPLPQWEEYLRKVPGTRLRTNVKKIPDSENPYICRTPRPWNPKPSPEVKCGEAYYEIPVEIFPEDFDEDESPPEEPKTRRRAAVVS